MLRYKLLDARIPALGCQHQALDNSGSLRLLGLWNTLAFVCIHGEGDKISAPLQNPNTLLL